MPTGVVVGKDDGGGVTGQSGFYYFTRVDAGTVDGAA